MSQKEICRQKKNRERKGGKEKLKTVAFDLETIANPAMIDHLPPIEPNPRLKDPEKIRDDIAEKS